MKPDLGTVTMILKVEIRLEISLWDALKMRLMGRLPAARILTHMLKELKR